MITRNQRRARAGHQRVKSETRRRLKRTVFGRDNFTCQAKGCGKVFDIPADWSGHQPIPGLTLGHIKPAAWGGRMSVENLKAECITCNASRGDTMWTEFLGD